MLTKSKYLILVLLSVFSEYIAANQTAKKVNKVQEL